MRARAGDFAAAAKAIMTTDTFPKVATATAKIGKSEGHHQRHRQGRRHDRARHGDDAVLHLHRCARSAAPALQALLKDGVADTFNAVTIDGDTSTSDTLHDVRHRQSRRTAPRIARASDPRLKAYRRRCRPCSPISPSRSRAMAKAPASWSRSWSKARCRKRRRARSPCRSPIRRW